MFAGIGRSFDISNGWWSNVFELVDDDPAKYPPAGEIEKHLGKEVNVLGYLITTKPVRTIKNDTMYFHTFIDAKVIG